MAHPPHTHSMVRKSKTWEQQTKYYEVDDFFEYLVSVHLNGQFNSFKELLKELRKSERKNFVDYVFEYVQKVQEKKSWVINLAENLNYTSDEMR